jgi:hypothetical protein
VEKLLTIADGVEEDTRAAVGTGGAVSLLTEVASRAADCSSAYVTSQEET